MAKERKMLNAKRTAVSVFIFLTGALWPLCAQALGQKPVRDASYYVQDLNVIGQKAQDMDIPVPETKILAKCGETGTGGTAVGVLLTTGGEAYGYSGSTSLDKYKEYELLEKNKEDIDKIFKYAEILRLETYKFNVYPESATVCGLDYLKNFQVHSTAWAKHPYLRADNPPPQELIVLFEAVHNIVRKLPVFPHGTPFPDGQESNGMTPAASSETVPDIEAAQKTQEEAKAIPPEKAGESSPEPDKPAGK